jgi:hypothetical protein
MYLVFNTKINGRDVFQSFVDKFAKIDFCLYTVDNSNHVFSSILGDEFISDIIHKSLISTDADKIVNIKSEIEVFHTRIYVPLMTVMKRNLEPDAHISNTIYNRMINDTKKNELPSIKTALKEAGRYNQVLYILNSIIHDEDLHTNSYPSNAYVTRGGQSSWRVNGYSVMFAAITLHHIISEDLRVDCTTEEFFFLKQHVDSVCDMILHNYAIEISHRGSHTTSMDKIRGWLVLLDILQSYGFFMNDGCEETEDRVLFYIPDGWKRLPEDDEEVSE